MKKQNLPNYITVLRIFGAICLISTEPFSFCFYMIYTLCGISDVVDGAIARISNNTTELGAKLDSIADLLFYAITLIKIFPFIGWEVPRIILYLIGIILLIRVISYIMSAIKFHRFSATHTYLNKLTGLSVFIIPYFAQTQYITPICFLACFIAIIASIEELIICIYSDTYNPNIKTILNIKK